MNKKTIITALLALVTLAISAQENNAGWLWEVSGNGLAQKSYLFGTCHGGGHVFTEEEVFGINGVAEAFNKVEAVFFESEMNPDARIISERVWMPVPRPPRGNHASRRLIRPWSVA